MKEFLAGNNENNMRISRFVEKMCPNMPKSALYKSFRNGRIKVNAKKIEPSYRINKGDNIQLYINDEFFKGETNKQEKVKKSVPPLKKEQIIFENDYILIVHKPVGVLVHSDISKDITLLEQVVSYLIEKKEYDPKMENLFQPAACNRIDRGTEGIVIFAKTFAALQEMNLYIKLQQVHKYYVCAVYGKVNNGTYTAYLSRDKSTKKATVNEIYFTGAKEIITKVKLLKTNAEYSLVEVGLITGRTHQIRAHLAFLSTPIIGDLKYGNQYINDKLKKKHQMLFAYKLVFSEEFSKSSILYTLAGKEIKVSTLKFEKEFESLS